TSHPYGSKPGRVRAHNRIRSETTSSAAVLASTSTSGRRVAEVCPNCPPAPAAAGAGLGRCSVVATLLADQLAAARVQGGQAAGSGHLRRLRGPRDNPPAAPRLRLEQHLRYRRGGQLGSLDVLLGAAHRGDVA